MAYAYFSVALMVKDSVGNYLLLSLKKLKIKRIYGIPGDLVIEFFKKIEDDPDLELVTMCHEPGVGFAAVGEARATRHPAVACVTFGVGGLNIMNAVACAYAEKTPLIVISGGAPKNQPLTADVWLHHTVKGPDSQFFAYKQITAEAIVLGNPQTDAQNIDHALKTCQELMLPVYIEIPANMTDQQINIDPKYQVKDFQADQTAMKAAADEIIKLILQAQKPVIMAGEEVKYFHIKDQLLAFAEKWNIPIVASQLGRDAGFGNHLLFFGSHFGGAGNPEAEALINNCDCLILFGAVLTDISMGDKLKQNVKQLVLCVSRQVKTPLHIYEKVPLRLLVKELNTRMSTPKKYGFPKKTQILSKPKNTSCELVTMDDVIEAVNWLFAESGEMPIVSDTAISLFVSLGIKASSVTLPGYYSSMGFAIPATIGYALGANQRPLVIVGDGSFQMTGQEICLCQRLHINPIVIVLNNALWGMEQVFHTDAHFNELVNWPYAQIADAWGGKGYYCDTSQKLYQALKDAKQQTKFTLIEVVLQKDDKPEPLKKYIKENIPKH